MLSVNRNILQEHNTLRRRILEVRAQWSAKFARDPLERDISEILHRALTRRQRAGVARLGEFEVGYRDAWTLYIEALYIWHRNIYKFPVERPTRILDGGSSYGVSVLYFKSRFPSAQIVAFEPDPEQFRLLTENLARNRVAGVETVSTALGGADDEVFFETSKSHGGHVVGTDKGGAVRVPMRRLSAWLGGGADILKLNVEGSEGEIFQEIEPQIRRIRNIVLEYHHIPGRPATLHHILNILDRNGFVYGVNDFDALINPDLQPAQMTELFPKYYLLVFATRIEG